MVVGSVKRVGADDVHAGDMTLVVYALTWAAFCRVVARPWTPKAARARLASYGGSDQDVAGLI